EIAHPTAARVPLPPSSPPADNGNRTAAFERDAAKRATRDAAKHARELAEIERRISEKEEMLVGVGNTINDPQFYERHPNPQSVFSEYAKLKEEIESLYAKLERLERRTERAVDAGR